ncbi:MAG: thymidylate synthase [Robiginitomaculum sp.]|nr:MAG: thymidylate synthase [Robiginitomaculum sp.]
MKQYLDLCLKALGGSLKENRTGINTIGYIGDFCQYDLAEGFPAVTTKRLAFKSVVAEMLGFLRGYDSAQQFRQLGSAVWDANANKNKQWTGNENRKGTDDLGRIYGVQARRWKGGIDQLKSCVENLSKGIDTRREIVTHWNPAEMAEMALPPCHLLYQFSIDNGKLCLSMYQRSCDVPLGVPFNIAGYSWLLSVIAQITGLKVGTFNHFMVDIHIYVNQIDGLLEQVKRKPKPLPTLIINPRIKTLEDLETWVTVDDFELKNYDHHNHIKYPFAV